MLFEDTVPWVPLERWNAPAFILAGVAFPISIALTAQTLFPMLETASVVFVFLALLATFVGLFGMYPRLARATPRLALSGLLTAAVGLLAILALLVYVVGSALLFGTPLQGEIGPTPVFFLVGIVGGGVSFLLFGLGSLRAPRPSQTVGVLLLVPAVIWPGYMVLDRVVGEQIAWLPFLVFGLVAVTLLGIGFLLRNGADPVDHTGGDPDVPT